MKRISVLIAAAASLASFASDGAEAPAGSPKFEVSGVVIQDDGVTWALVSEPQFTQGKVRLVAPGTAIGPYTLTVVARDHIVLRGPAETSFRVPFSWRSGGTAAPADSGARPAAGRPVPGTVGAAPGITRPVTDPETARAGALREPAAPREGEESARQTETEGATASAPASEPGGAKPPASTIPPPERVTSAIRGTPSRLEEFRRARERTLREELTVEGYFYDKKK